MSETATGTDNGLAAGASPRAGGLDSQRERALRSAAIEQFLRNPQLLGDLASGYDGATDPSAPLDPRPTVIYALSKDGPAGDFVVEVPRSTSSATEGYVSHVNDQLRKHRLPDLFSDEWLDADVPPARMRWHLAIAATLLYQLRRLTHR